jgi:hypothetical protein
MRFLTLVFLALVTFSASAETSKNVSFGMHGMALFGDSAHLYASHLPMFHAPHDYQVILEIDLEDAKRKAELNTAMQTNPHTLWTIAPEKFNLTDLWHRKHRLKSFKADLFKGHFERGGTLRMQGVIIKVSSVIFHQHLRTAQSTSGTQHYDFLATNDGYFAYKRIQARPDFDHIFFVDQKPIKTSIRLASNTTESLLNQALRAQWKDTSIHTIYLEYGDLR